MLKKGVNTIEINSPNLEFNNVDNSLRMVGFKLSEDQARFWPWDKNSSFDYQRNNYMPNSYYYDVYTKTTFHLPTILNKIKSNNGLKDYKYDTPQLNECNQEIISDRDSSIILKVNCN